MRRLLRRLFGIGDPSVLVTDGMSEPEEWRLTGRWAIIEGTLKVEVRRWLIKRWVWDGRAFEFGSK